MVKFFFRKRKIEISKLGFLKVIRFGGSDKNTSEEKETRIGRKLCEYCGITTKID